MTNTSWPTDGYRRNAVDNPSDRCAMVFAVPESISKATKMVGPPEVLQYLVNLKCLPNIHIFADVILGKSLRTVVVNGP